MAESANWGQMGVNWGLLAPRIDTSPQNTGNAFAAQQAQQQQMQEQRRQFEATHGLRQQEFNQRASQHNDTIGIARNADGRASESHKWDMETKRIASDDKAFERLGAMNDVFLSAKTPEERAYLMNGAVQNKMITQEQAKQFSGSENAWRMTQARLQRMKESVDAERAKGAAGTDKTKSEAELHRAQAEFQREQANKLRAQQEDPITMLMRQQAQQMINGGQGQSAPQQPRGLQQQSAPVEATDPNLIQTQGAAQPPATSPANQPMVSIGSMKFPLNIAESMQFQAARDKNQPLADLIGNAIGKVPKALQDDIGKAQLGAINQRARVENILDAYDPEWLTIDGKLKMTGLNWADSIGPLRDSIAPEQRQKMARYNTFTTAAFQNLNEYVKEVTGAAVGIQEEGRIRAGIPDPQKDGPQQFIDKAKETLKIAGLAEIRMRFMAKNGLKFDRNTVHADFPFSKMQDVIQQRTRDLQKTMQQQGLQGPQLEDAVTRQLKAEFQT